MQTYLTVELSSRLGLDNDSAIKLGNVIDKAGKARKERREKAKAEMDKLRELVEQRSHTHVPSLRPRRHPAQQRRLEFDRDAQHRALTP